MVGDRKALSKTSRTFCLPHLKTQSLSVFFCPLRNWNQLVTTPDFLLLHGVTLDSRHNKQWWTRLMKRECVRGASIGCDIMFSPCQITLELLFYTLVFEEVQGAGLFR